MCKVLSDYGEDSFNAVASQPASLALKRNLLPLEAFFQEMKRVLSSAHQNPGNVPRSELQEDWKPEGGKPSPVPSFLRDGNLHSAEEKHDNFPTGTEFVSEGTSNLSTTESNMPHNISPSEIPGEEIIHCSLNGDTDIEMVEKQDDTDVSTVNVAMDITE
uniref:Uncharacterized protein n=4 Tax=Solanum tuberosum TaxID=4113 RepID=M1CGQ8_SOLTU